MCGITVGFSKAKNNIFPIFSWLIMLVEKRPYSHAYMKWYDPYIDKNIIYEARGLTVHLISETRFLQSEDIIAEFRIELQDDNVKKQVLKHAFDTIEAKYSFIQLLGLGVVKIFKNFGKTISNPFDDNNRTGYICSEVVAEVLKKVLNVPITEDLDSISPSDLYKIVEILPNARKIN